MVSYTRHIMVVALLAVLPGNAARKELSIAAAANLIEVFRPIGALFETATGIHPVFSFGSTAQLTQQIEHAAPYDVIAAADKEHVDELDRKGLLSSGSRAVYAIGILALWIPPRSKAQISRIEDLNSPDVRIIAAAKPELAPYGRAAVQTLRHLGIWDGTQSKMTYASNISMARQYGVSGNADAVFTAASLVRSQAGRVIPVDENLHQPIEQSLGIIASSTRQTEARMFVEFLLAGKGRDVLAKSGYRVPASGR